MLFLLLGGVVLLVLLVLFLFATYTVVEPNKAHVVVSMGGGRKVFHPSKEGSQSSYFYIPQLMRRIIVSLENVKHEINEIALHDKNVAPFLCDITCWFKITNADLAAEKLDVSRDGSIMDSVRDTLNAQVQGVARAAAMNQEILELMRDRDTFGDKVFEVVNGDLNEWGVQLVKLEIIDFADTDGSHVIADYEARREAEISSETRKVKALKEQEAVVKEAEAKQISETARILSEETIQLRDVERSQKTQIKDQVAKLEVEKQTQKANEQAVEAQRTLEVGQAEIKAKAVEVEAQGKALAEVRFAEGRAEAGRKIGIAEADVVKAKGTAQAEAIEKQADAQKKFTDSSKEIEMAKMVKEIEMNKATAIAKALEKANINIVSPDMNFMGIGVNEGAGLGVLAKALKDVGGINVGDFVNKIASKVEEKMNVSK